MMKFGRLAVIAATALAVSAERPAQAEGGFAENFTFNTITRLATQYTLLVARTMVDLTYEHLAVDPRTGDIVITGLALYPALDWDSEGTCEISIGRISRSDQFSFEAIESHFEVTGLTVAPSCLPPEQASMMGAFDYDGITVDGLSVDLSYEFASSAAQVAVHAAVKDAAAVTITAALDYVWITGLSPDPDNAGDNLHPVALLSEAEISIENRGLFERVEPMLTAQLGDLSVAPQMIEAVLMQALTDGGTQAPTEAGAQFVQNVASEVGRFITDKDRIVLSVAPPEGVWLNEDVFSSPTNMIVELNPTVSQAPLISRSLVSTAELNAAIAGGAALDEASALRIGQALVTGLGAPRSVAHGMALLEPLADQWHGGAALLVAQALATDGEAGAAYHMALRASAAGEAGALSLVDRLEEGLGTDFVLAAQADAAAGWPGAGAQAAADQGLIDTVDIGAMRERAQRAALGRDVPRNYMAAYYWASLAAAAGDRSSAGLRERLDRRFSGAEGAARDAWKEASRSAAAAAIQTWTEDGLGARVAELYGVAQ